jgi:cytochrome c-type biogenesis protein CcmH/NrfG
MRDAAATRPRARDANRWKELMTLGDRLFRAGNLIRAAERYEQAIRANPDEADPIVRLAQVALVRGKYGDAALKLREAQNAEPGWLATAADVRALFPEPADFARQVAKLEAHLQARPEDRDGWLVLGALWYLSGRTQKAADVFLRLSDRRPDATLKAFLAATNAEVGAD